MPAHTIRFQASSHVPDPHVCDTNRTCLHALRSWQCRANRRCSAARAAVSGRTTWMHRLYGRHLNERSR